MPWSSVENSTAKKTMLKKSWSCWTSSITGNVASTTGTAPRRPAQPRNAFSRHSKPLPIVATSVATGRATKTTTSASSVPLPAISPSSDGNTSRPSVRNMPSCATQASPSWNAVTVRLAGRSADPSMSPHR